MKIILIVIGFLLSSTFLLTESFAQSVNLPNDFGTIVYESAYRYYVKDSHDNIIAGNNTPDLVIKTALDGGGDVYIANGTYNLTPNFSGFDLKSNTHLKLAENARIVVPSGYEGYIFRFNGISHCILEGGQILEADPVQRNWIGIMMQGNTNAGVYFNFIQNMNISNPYIVIDFNAATGQWINANTFVNISGNSFVRGIEFDFNGKHTHSVDGFDGNTFRDSQFESGSVTTYGAKDIRHDRNSFYNVQFWDLPPGAISSTIDPSAENTVIIGGTMTHLGFVDKGMNTLILDSWHPKNFANSTIISALIKNSVLPQVNTVTPSSHQVLKMSIIAEPTSGFVSGNQAQLSVSVGNPVTVNIFGTVTNSKGGSVHLDIIRPDGFVEQNQADVTSDGSFYYPMIFDKDSLTGQYQIDGSYQNSNLGELLLNVTSDQISLPNENHSNISVAPPSNSNTTLTTLIKISAKLWSQGQISDNTFGESIQYLIKNGIVELPNQNQIIENQSMFIPSWFKNNAGWWADGQISSSDFISEVQYLIDNGIIQTPS